PQARGTSALAMGVGIAGAAAGGAYGVYNGLKQGGVQGTAIASGSLAGTTSAILMMAGVSGPLAPVLGGIGLALGAIAGFMGNPKEKASERQQRDIEGAKFKDATVLENEFD